MMLTPCTKLIFDANTEYKTYGLLGEIAHRKNLPITRQVSDKESSDVNVRFSQIEQSTCTSIMYAVHKLSVIVRENRAGPKD